MKIFLWLLIAVTGWLLFACQSSPNTSPTPQPTNLEELIGRLTDGGRKEIVEDNEKFRVFWSQLSQDFLVVIDTTSFDEVKKEVEDWFLQQGFSRPQLCEAGVHFAASKDIAPQFGFEDAVPTGCPLNIPTPLAPLPDETEGVGNQ